MLSRPFQRHRLSIQILKTLLFSVHDYTGITQSNDYPETHSRRWVTLNHKPACPGGAGGAPAGPIIVRLADPSEATDALLPEPKRVKLRVISAKRSAGT